MITHSKHSETKAKPGRKNWLRTLVMPLVAIVALAALSGCATTAANLQSLSPASSSGIPAALSPVVHEVAHHFGIDDERLHELGWG